MASFNVFSLVLLDEPGLVGSLSTATLTVERARGSFTEVTVYWEITTSSTDSDVSPTSANVTFSGGQTTATFTISALEDEVIITSLSFPTVINTP